MKKPFVLLLFISMHFVLYSEINTGNSLEWLCADAELIARGHIKSYSENNPGNNLCTIVFETKEIFKGTTESPLEIVTYMIAKDSLEKYMAEQTSLIVFLKEEKSLRGKKQKTRWGIMEAYNAIPAMINLMTPQKALISASTFSVCETREQIIAACRLCLKKIAGYEVEEKTVFMNYLAIPPQTMAYDFLYVGSKCYLTVPDFMFPDSREKPY